MSPGARRAAGIVIAVAVLLSLTGLALTATRAVAVYRQVTETGRPGYLSLAVDSSTPLHGALGSGESMSWLIEASLDDARVGRLSLELRGSGALVDLAGMTAEVLACSRGFVPAPGHAAGSRPAAPRCRGGAATVVPTTPVAQLSRDAGRFSLAELRRGDPRELLVTLRIPADASPRLVVGRTARVGVGLHVSGVEQGEPTGTPELPRTGVEAGADARALAVLATGLICLGAGAALRRRAERGTP